MTPKTKANIEIAAAILLIFTAMLDPRISAGLAVIALIALAIYEYRSG